MVTFTEDCPLGMIRDVSLATALLGVARFSVDVHVLCFPNDAQLMNDDSLPRRRSE